MNLSLAFADSEVAGLDASGDSVHIRLSAAHVFRRDDAGGKPEEGFARGVRLVLHGARLCAPPADFFGRIREGRVQAGGAWESGMALPGTLSGPLKIELALYNGAQLALAVDSIESRFEGPPNFAESLFC